MRDDQVVGRRVEHVMGTVFSIDVRDPVGTPVLDGVVEWLHWVDHTFSTYRPDSDISLLDRGEVSLSACEPEVADILERCAELEELTHGAFSAYYDGGLDPSGLVKGWAIERAAEMLTEAGSHRHAVNGGGDVRVVGEAEPGRPWQIGIADPLHPGELAAVVQVVDAGVATSGVAERGLHVIDPRTGQPVRAYASLTVVGPDLALADAYATAAMVMGSKARTWLEDLDGYEAFAITSDGLRWQTTGFHDLGPDFTASSQVGHSGGQAGAGSLNA